MAENTTHPTDIPPGESDGEGDTCDAAPAAPQWRQDMAPGRWYRVTPEGGAQPIARPGDSDEAVMYVTSGGHGPAPAPLADALRQCVEALTGIYQHNNRDPGDGNALGHCHKRPGIWDGSGHSCKWCAAWASGKRAVVAARAALDGAQPPEPAREPSDPDTIPSCAFLRVAGGRIVAAEMGVLSPLPDGVHEVWSVPVRPAEAREPSGEELDAMWDAVTPLAVPITNEDGTPRGVELPVRQYGRAVRAWPNTGESGNGA